MTLALVLLSIGVVLLASAVAVLLRLLLRRPRQIVLGVIPSTDETIRDLRAAVDDLTSALSDAGNAAGGIEKSTKELES